MKWMTNLSELGHSTDILKTEVSNEWPAWSPNHNPIKHHWGYLGKEMAALSSLSKFLNEKKQGFLSA